MKDDFGQRGGCLPMDVAECFVTYNVNGLVFQELMNNVHIYRPRFIRVKLPPILTAP
jgi:hypothetical protein